MKKLGLIVLFSICSYFVCAQTGTLRVSVYDKNTGEAPVGATVVIAGTTKGNTIDFRWKDFY